MSTTQKIWRYVLVAAIAVQFGAQVARADSVGQVQTTKYFAPETVAMIKQRVLDVSNGVPGATLGFKQGDTISYIIQFTPIANTTTIGAGGYITDYIPPGTQVTGAWFVQPDGLGGFYQTMPPDPAQMADGFGVGGAGGYTANWTSDPYTISTCTAAGLTLATCTGNLAQLYADTGIFYSTDPRTTVFTDPSTDGRVRQWGATTGGNGYYVNPTRGGQLVPLMGGTVGTNLPTTHNVWDAAMTNAWGTNVLPANMPNAGIAKIDTNGAGLPPFNAGSPVAGPQTGYQLDYTGNVGPWKRIAYPGSMIGSNAFTPTNPAKAAGVNTVLAMPISSGASFPLPDGPGGTTAVRWAAGRLVVGTQNYVKISLKLTAPPPALGLINNSEVFGGDGSPESAGGGNRDSAWVYHVPSVANNTSTFYILKEVVCVYDATGTCVANNGANLPTTGTPATMGPKVRYRITFINTNNGTQHNVVLCDQLPNLVGLTFANVTQVSSVPNMGAPISPAAASCGFGAGGPTFSYPPIPSLAGGGAGVITFDVQYPVLTAGTVVSNQGKAVTDELTAGVTTNAPSNVVASLQANLKVTKIVSPSKANKGDTVTYTINIANTGGNPAGLTSLADTLPGVLTGVVAQQAPSRFNYVATSSITLNGAPLSGVTAVMTLPATNTERVTWTFPQGTSLPGGGLLTLVFTATVGNNTANNLMVYGTAYSNTATVTYTGGAAATATTGVTAPVTVSIPNLQLTKTIDCVFIGGVCTAGSYVPGSSIPPNALLRYKIVYTNPEAAAQTITLSDTLPVSTTAAGNLYVASGPDVRPSTPALSVNPAAAGAARGADAALTAIAGGSVVNLTAVNLPGTSSGALYMDVQTNVAAAGVVTNTASINSTQRTTAGGAAVTSAVNATAASLAITKTSNLATVAPGGTVIYTITVQNTGAVGVPVTSVVDTLPFATVGTIAYTATNSMTINGVAQTGVAGAPAAGQYTNPAPAAAAAGVSQVVTWTLPAGGTTINAGQSLVLSFTVTYSATVPRGATIYKNNATVNYTGGSSLTGPVAPVTVPYNTLSVSKAVVAPAPASIAPNNQVTYAITVTNTGTTAVPVTSVVDFLPAATAGLISYLSTSSVVVSSGAAGTNVVTTTVAAVGVQQQITWTLTGASINPGGTMVITFIAQFGAIPTGVIYYNDVQANYTGGQATNQKAFNQAPVNVPVISKITKTIDCVYNPTCVPGSYVDGTPIPVNAKLGYKIVYENLSALAVSGVTITDILPAAVGANAISNLIVNGVVTAAPANAAGGGTVTLLAGAALNPVNTAGSTGTITFDLQTTVTSGAGVTNTGKITSTQDPVGLSSSATAGATGGNLTVTKDVTAGTSSTVAVGGTASYTITVKNDGAANATLNTLADTLPGVPAAAPGTTSRFTYAATGAMTLNGATIAPAYTAAVTAPAAPATANNETVTWTFTGGLIIPAGQSLKLTFTALVGTTVTKNATYYNSVTASYTGGVFPSAVATGQAPVLVPTNTLTMTKTIDCVYSGAVCTPGSYVPGTPIPVSAKVGYKLYYTNLSPVANTGVTVTDILPTQVAANAISNLIVNGVVTAAPANAAGGGTVTLLAGGTLAAAGAAGSTGTITFDLQTNAASGVTVSNTGSITSTQQATAVTSNVSAVVLNLAQLAVTKTTSTPTLAPGNRATYTITIQNNGAGATSTLKVLDFLPFDGGTADPAKRLNYFSNISYAVNGVPTALTPTITTSVPPTVAPFGSNTNQQQVQWDFGNNPLAQLASGVPTPTTLTITFTADVGANMTTGLSYSNSAQAQYTSNSVSLVNTVQNTAPINLIPHVTLSKTIVAVCGGTGCTPTAYTPGALIPPNAKIRYQITYTNPSATTAQTNVVLSDVLPTQTAAASVSNVVASGPITAPSAATLSALGAGGATLTFPTLANLPASGTGTITFDVQTNAPAASAVSNTATVVSAEDVNGVTSTATATVTSLTLSKSIDCVYSGATCTAASYVPGTVIPANAKVKYKIIYSNASATTAQTNVVLTDVLPTQTAATPVSNVVVAGPITAPSAATLSALGAGGATLTFPALASLPASGTGTITFDVQTNAPAASTVNNTAKLVSTEDVNGVTSTATATVTSLTLSKIIDCVYSGAICTPGSYVAGTVIPANAKVKYKIIYSNASATTAQTNVVLTDVLPTQTAAVPVSNVVAAGPITAPSAATLSALAAGGATLTFPTLASLPASGTGTITMDVQTNATASNIVSNSATAMSTEDPTGVTSTAAATVSLLTLTKTTSTPNVMLGGTATYTISITNNSATPTNSLQVYDFLPYSGAAVDATKRFAYVSTTGYTGGLPAPVSLTFPVGPTVAPYNANANQQQVLWDFGGYNLPAGATVTITFTATVGSAIPAASYTNSAGYQYTSAAGPGSMNADGLAAIAALAPPVLSFTKLVYVFSDPVNGTTNPKFIPGALAAYTLMASNAGGAVDNNATVITDPVPANTALFVNDIGVAGSGPVAFTDGATPSGLTYAKATDLSFSNDNGATWAYAPTPGADGCDPLVTNLKINPKGAFAGNATAPSPSFQLGFRVCVK